MPKGLTLSHLFLKFCFVYLNIPPNSKRLMFNTDNLTFLSYLRFRYIPAYQTSLAGSSLKNNLSQSNVSFPSPPQYTQLLGFLFFGGLIYPLSWPEILS